MGIPVVATDLPEIRRYNARHGPLVEVASGPDAFAAAIRRSLNGAPAGLVQQRVAAAHENSWQSRISAMNALIDEALERRAVVASRWDETLRRVYREARTPFAAILLACRRALLLVFHTNFVWLAARPLTVAEPVAPADADRRVCRRRWRIGQSRWRHGRAGPARRRRVQEWPGAPPRAVVRLRLQLPGSAGHAVARSATGSAG